jgi:hypothetical protein
MIRRALFLAAVLATQACSDRVCTTAGCQDGAWLRADASASWDRLRAATITTCHNDICVTGSLAALPQMPPAVGMGFGFSLGNGSPDGGAAPVNVGATGREGGIFAIDVGWPGSFGTKDGDRYRLTVTDAGGATLISLDEAATYEIVQPNGAECGPTCRWAVIDRSAR